MEKFQLSYRLTLLKYENQDSLGRFKIYSLKFLQTL